MKILFIHNNYASNTSGEEFAAEALERLLVNNGHEVAWYRRFSDVINNSFPKKVSAFFLGLYNPRAIREIRQLLDDFKPDVVQIQNLYPFISPSIIRAIRRKGIPIVMRCPNYRLFCPTGLHMDGQGKLCERCLSGSRELNCIAKNCENDIPKSIGYALRNFMARTLWGITRNMDAYIVQTTFQREKFIKNGIPAKKLFIVPGITPAITTYNDPAEAQYVSFIGRLSEEKGIKEFLEVARLLPGLPFVVVGDDSKFHDNLRANSPSNVIWKGFLSGKDLDLVFKQSKIVVVPSKWYEGFPNIITRAMKHAKPVITSNIGAMSAIIDHGENGLVVAPGDTLELAKAVKELYEDSRKCQLFGVNARRKADTFYTTDRVYNHLITLYDRLLKEKKKETRKILSILHYPPPVHGAAMVGQYIMDSDVINDHFSCRYINLGTSLRINEIGTGGWTKFRRFIRITKQTFQSLRTFKPNLVYITITASGAGFYKDAVIVMLAKAFGKKLVFHFHNKGVSRRQNIWLDNALYKMVFRNSEVILLSRHLYKDIEKYVPLERVHFCANGIPVNKIIKPEVNIDNDKVQLLFLSNLIESKGVYVLLEACQLLEAKGLPFHCTFIGNEGDISIQKFQEKVLDLGLANCVHYVGSKYGSEKEIVYSISDIFVFPSYYYNECFPLVLIEAMQHALPVVSTLEGGIPEVVSEGETGFLVTQKDSELLAKKLELLISDPELREKMGKAGRRRYEEYFTLGLFERRFSRIMQELV